MARDLRKIQNVVLVCQGKDCKKNGAKDVLCGVKSALKDLGAHRETMIVKTKCTGQCKKAPVMGIQPHGVWLTEGTEKSAAATIHATIGERLKIVS
ncbi:(2Fe-2S) ferredoxin domain-containing protein [Microvenator marinus]|jgi:NADH:ubiquinone oxidoreductase subunit E|nr:(2Fe-2S) ferredoxin domain-containing protein [Microvenator marinus]